jgi:short-subunit dehydrogenase
VVQALCPGFTRTEMQETAGVDRRSIPSRAWMEADDVVVASLRALRQGRAVCIPGTHYKTVAALSRVLPKTAVRRLAGRLNRGKDS